MIGERRFLAGDVFVFLLHAIQSEWRSDDFPEILLLLIQNQFGSSSGSYEEGSFVISLFPFLFPFLFRYFGLFCSLSCLI